MNHDEISTELSTEEALLPVRELLIEEVLAVAGGPEIVNDRGLA